MPICQESPDTFGGFLFEIIIGAVVGAIIHPIFGWLVGSLRSGIEMLDALLVRSAIFYNGFALMPHIVHGLLGIVCSYNIIHILGAGNLDKVNGFNVYDTQWIRIGITLYFFYMAQTYKWAHYKLAQDFTLAGLLAYTIFGFVVSRSNVYDTVWVCFFGQVGSTLLVLITSFFYINSTKLLGWKSITSMIPLGLFLTLNALFGLGNNPRYNWFTDRTQVYVYPAISVGCVLLSTLYDFFVIPMMEGRFGDPANKYGDLIPDQLRKQIIAKNKEKGTYRDWAT